MAATILLANAKITPDTPSDPRDVSKGNNIYNTI